MHKILCSDLCLEASAIVRYVLEEEDQCAAAQENERVSNRSLCSSNVACPKMLHTVCADIAQHTCTGLGGVVCMHTQAVSYANSCSRRIFPLQQRRQDYLCAQEPSSNDDTRYTSSKSGPRPWEVIDYCLYVKVPFLKTLTFPYGLHWKFLKERAHPYWRGDA